MGLTGLPSTDAGLDMVPSPSLDALTLKFCLHGPAGDVAVTLSVLDLLPSPTWLGGGLFR